MDEGAYSGGSGGGAADGAGECNRESGDVGAFDEGELGGGEG